jgi:hypothetical protein
VSQASQVAPRSHRGDRNGDPTIGTAVAPRPCRTVPRRSTLGPVDAIKAHGTANDFVVLTDLDEQVELSAGRRPPPTHPPPRAAGRGGGGGAAGRAAPPRGPQGRRPSTNLR